MQDMIVNALPASQPDEARCASRIVSRVEYCVCSVSCVCMRGRVWARGVRRVGFQPSPRAAGNLRHATAPPHVSECLSLEGGGLGSRVALAKND